LEIVNIVELVWRIGNGAYGLPEIRSYFKIAGF
jgi:hypothetical protein